MLSPDGQKIWKEEIEEARRKINAANDNPDVIYSDYNMSINPEDFLDLINGKWDVDA